MDIVGGSDKCVTEVEVRTSSPSSEAASLAENCRELEQEISSLIPVVLNKINVASVIGVEIVESWDFDWTVLEPNGSDESHISFDDPRFVTFLKDLNYALLVVATTRRQCSAFQQFYFFEFIPLKHKIKVVHVCRLQILCHQYFTPRFPGSVLSFGGKTCGIQLGGRVVISVEGAPDITYYVKSHSRGRVQSSSNAPSISIFDPKELMVYKILEHLGLGCETHFLENSLEDVYIATLDASQHGHFKEFSVAVGSSYQERDEIYGTNIWGSLESICANENRTNIDIESMEANIQCDNVATNFLHQISLLDMLSRIMGVHDLLNNTDNFGFFTSAGSMPKLKVVDFRLDNIVTVGPAQFQVFLNGMGTFRYQHAHCTLRYCLHDRENE